MARPEHGTHHRRASEGMLEEVREKTKHDDVKQPTDTSEDKQSEMDGVPENKRNFPIQEINVDQSNDEQQTQQRFQACDPNIQDSNSDRLSPRDNTICEGIEEETKEEIETEGEVGDTQRYNPGFLPQGASQGFQFPPGCIFILNDCSNIQFGSQNTINSTHHHEHQSGDKFNGLNPEFLRMLINLGDPQKEKEMVNDLQDEDKCKDLVSGLKAFGTQLKTAKEGCVLLDFELSKDPEERLRFLRSCQSGEFQRFIQDNLLSRYVKDPTKVSMVLCFSIASITDTGCGEMAFNFNLLQGGYDVTASAGLEGLRQYATLSGLTFVESGAPNQSDLQSCLGDVLDDPEQRSAFELHLLNAQNTLAKLPAVGNQLKMSALAEVLQRPVRLITALENSFVDVLILPSQPLNPTCPTGAVVIGAYDKDHYVRMDYVTPEAQAATSGGPELHSDDHRDGAAEEEEEGITWEKTDSGHALHLNTTINDLTRQTRVPDTTDSRWASLTSVTFVDCTVDLKNTEDSLTIEVRTNNIKQDPTTLESVLALFPQRSNVAKLYLGGNKLRQLPDGMVFLPNLTCLSAPKNKLKKLPASILDLTSLTVVDLNRNHLTKFPEDLQLLPLLEKVFLCSNKIKSIPVGVLSKMKNLQVLAIDKNNLKGVPKDIVESKSLVELHIKGNPLSSLPRMVFSMTSLKLLGVDRNVWEGFLKHNDDARYRPSFNVCFDRCQHMGYDRKQNLPKTTNTTTQKVEDKQMGLLEEEDLPNQGSSTEEESRQEGPTEQGQEDPPISPSAEMSLTTHVSSMDDYNSTYRRSIEDPAEFWREISEEFHWETGPEGKFVDHNFDPNVGDVFVRWMSGATTNITYNLLEKNIREKCLGSALALQWQGDDDAERREVTYAQLKSLVCRAANMLKAKGIKRGHRVMIYMPQTVEQVVAMLACVRIGAVHCVVYGGATAEYLADRVKDSKCTAIITADFAKKDGGRQPMKTEVDRALKICGKEHSVHSCIVVRRVGDGEPDVWTTSAGPQEKNVPWCDGRDYWWQEEMGRVDDECEPEWMDAEDPLLILYTSGSTGSPKGVIHTVGGYMMYTATTFKYVFDCGNVADKVHFCTADLGWVTGQSYVIYGPLLNGVTTVLLEGDPLKANRIVTMVRRYNVTSLYTTPTAIRHMKATSGSDANYKLDTLRVVGTVGEPIARSTWRWYRSTIGRNHCSVVDTYWQTETGGHVMTPLPGATPMKPGSTTLPFFGVEPAVLSDDGKEMAGQCEGHLVFKSPWPGMMRGINGKPEKFTSYFQQFPGYYYTGDRCRRDADGYYRILGRREDRVSIPGAMGQVFNQLDVEATLLQHPDVEDVAVVTTDPTDDSFSGSGASSSGGYDNWYIFVTLRQTACLTETIFNTLREMLATTLHIFTPPSHIHCASELPKTWSDKVLRRLLRKVVLNDLDLGDFHVVANLRSLTTLFRQCRDMQTSCDSIEFFTKPRTMPS
ncbi:ACSS2 [Branchiostoma lanceolatum]|uniref:acetate--CoA ligase n=1 Tax=Branchiostoma lanceolatum TaxID=7740 RepID=A0A8J9YWB4_BRALA|nr:ACSS2 [Branchiostoma lanceolatum]